MEIRTIRLNKTHFFQAVIVSTPLCECTTWTLTKRIEKRLDDNCTRMLRSVFYKSWRQHPTKMQLYGYLPPISNTIQIRRARHPGHCWKSKGDVLLWIASHGRAKIERPARTYLQQLCSDTGCSREDMQRALDDMDDWWQRVREIHNIYVYIYNAVRHIYE